MHFFRLVRFAFRKNYNENISVLCFLLIKCMFIIQGMIVCIFSRKHQVIGEQQP